MELDWIDSYNQPEPPDASTAQDNELLLLTQVAQKIPCLEWEYDEGVDPTRPGTHIGFITQALQQVPGLASAVSENNGVQTFDSSMVAAASLSLVAALARKVLNIDLSKDYKGVNDEPDISGTELSTEISNSEPTNATESSIDSSTSAIV